jgi:hydroxyacylglutathione hydrolase
MSLLNFSAKRAGLLVAVATLSILLTAQAQTGDKRFPSHPWFTVQQVATDVLRISDHDIDNIYLVLGRDSAMLIDNGVGAVDLKLFVQSLTHLPLIVVNTHSHPDHTGSNHQFATVRAHEDEIAMIRFFGTKAMRTTMAKAMQGQAQAQGPKLKLPDSVLFHETDTTYVPAIVPFRDGYVFDLGGRKIEVIHVPGHTKGSICLLDKKQKLLFTGDSFGSPIWLHPQDALSVETYRQSVGRLSQRQKDFETLLPGHGPALDKAFMKEQMACADEIVSGQCKGEPYDSFVGKGMVCTYKRAKIAFDPQRIKSR